jgi:hypothetical protein
MGRFRLNRFRTVFRREDARPPDVSWSASRVPLRRVVLRWSAKRLLDVEQHENGGDNDDIQEQPDNGDRVVGIALVARRVFRQRR